jgi:hypothetical protein
LDLWQRSDAISTHAELDRSFDRVLQNVDNNVTVNAASTTIVAPGAWRAPREDTITSLGPIEVQKPATSLSS